MSNFAMIFPGQGSQYIGMLADLGKNFDIVKKTFLESSDVLGYDLWDLIQNGIIEDLNQTWKTQPAILSASVSIFRIWQQQNGQIPKFMAGHSLGEYSALVCAGVIDFQSAIKLVEIRGKLMHKSIPLNTGAMYVVIGLNAALVVLLCQKITTDQEEVSVVNFNSPKQVVIGGKKNAVEKVVILCKNAGARYIIPISISVPSHCKLMKPAAKKLAKILEKNIFYKPKIPVINNVDVKIENSVKCIKDALMRQLYNPVRWIEIIEFMAVHKIKQFFEIGPGQVLSGLTKRISNNLCSISINDTKSLNAALKK